MKTEVRRLRMSYRDEGDGPALVLLHAFPLSGAMWSPQIDALRDTARVIAPDLRGFGETDAPPGLYFLDDLAQDVLGLLDSIDIDRFVLGGLSMGGYLSFALLRRIDRRRLRGLILADTRAGADTDEARANREKMANQTERDGSEPIAEAMAGTLLGETSLKSRPELVERVRSIIRRNAPAGIAGALRAMAARPDSTDLLRILDVPTLILVGEEDRLTPPDAAWAMADEIPGARVVTLPRAGHLSNMETPEAFNDEVRASMGELPSSPGET